MFTESSHHNNPKLETTQSNENEQNIATWNKMKYGLKNTRYKRAHIVWFHLYKIQTRAKLTYGLKKTIVVTLEEWLETKEHRDIFNSDNFLFLALGAGYMVCLAWKNSLDCMLISCTFFWIYLILYFKSLHKI